MGENNGVLLESEEGSVIEGKDGTVRVEKREGAEVGKDNVAKPSQASQGQGSDESGKISLWLFLINSYRTLMSDRRTRTHSPKGLVKGRGRRGGKVPAEYSVPYSVTGSWKGRVEDQGS